MKASPTAADKPKGAGKVRGVHIRKAANGHTMSVDREGEYDSQPRVYSAGMHPQMFADASKALGLPAAAAAKKKPFGAPRSGKPPVKPSIGAQMLGGK